MIYHKEVKRNPHTGFPIPNQETLIIDRNGILMVIVGVVFAMLFLWRKHD